MLRKTMILLGLPLVFAACERTSTAPVDVLPADGAALLAKGGTSAGLVRTTWPSAEDPGPPFYARIEPVPPHVYTVDGWAVIPFYRDPACIPADFNLLDFFDPPSAFGCPLRVEGFGLWHGAVGAGAPKVVQSRGTGAVPVWFIPAAVFDAMQDGVLTIGELAALPGRLVGYASHFTEVNHPHPLPPFLGGGGHPNPKLVISARGTLNDGRRFQYHLTRHDMEVSSIRLRFW